MTRAAFIVDAVRTPFGRYGGGLSGVRPDDLAAEVIRHLLGRTLQDTAALPDEVIFGNANGAGEENRNVARMALLLAGVPTSVPAVTVNRLCASGMQAVIDARRSIAVSDADVVLAGGVESMSRAPWVLPKPSQAFPRGSATMESTTLGWRLVNPRMPSAWTVGLGNACDELASSMGISREEQDAFAAASQQKAHDAWASGALQAEIVQIEAAPLAQDEQMRATSAEALAKLKPLSPGGTVTAGNASGLNDGAAALLVAAEDALPRIGRTPLARIVSSAAAGVDPQRFGIGPVEAANTALRRAGIGWSDLSIVELNEAFASQSLACIRSWPDLDPGIVNPLGGAIAMGHPLGASGARILGSLAHQLHARGGGFGLATMCVGVGQGVAVVLEGV